MDPLVRFSTALFWSLAESAPYLVVGYFVVALVREFVPAAVLTRHLGGSGARPLLNSLGIGALLPVCSCGSIPLGIGLARSGAAVGTVLALMTSSPAISPVSVVLGYSLLGPELLAVFAVTVLVGSFLLGFIGNYLFRTASPDPLLTVLPNDACLNLTPPVVVGWLGRLRRAARWAYGDLGADVSVDLLIGLSVAAAIIAFVPPEWTTAWLGEKNTWAMLCVILVSIPMYTCSVPALLVMHSLLLSGASPGAAVAFLIAGPASNLGEVNAIRGSLGNRTALYYAASLVTIALVGGTITDRLIFRDRPYVPPAVAATAATEPDDAAATVTGQAPVARGIADVAKRVPAWHYPFMAALAGVLVVGVVQRVRRMRQ